MSIIPCPECGKEISNKAVICRNCGHHLGEATEEDIAIFEARKLRDRIYRLNMFSYLVITVFLAGFAWYWWESKGFSQMSSAGPFIMMGITAIAYLVVRGLLFKARQERKARAQKRQLSNELRKNL
jgi:uncharacterized membrane protein